MNTWAVQDAKSRFSEFLQASLSSGPQLVTKRGVEAAVLVSIAQWHQLQTNPQPSLKQVLLEDAARGDWEIPPRGQGQPREPVVF